MPNEKSLQVKPRYEDFIHFAGHNGDHSVTTDSSELLHCKKKVRRIYGRIIGN